MAPKTSPLSLLSALSRPCSAAATSSSSLSSSSASSTVRTFTSTPCREKMTRARYQMFEWLNGRDGTKLRDGTEGPTYLGPLNDQPFPNNPLFRSQPVLTDATRELIWRKIIERGESIKAVSAEIGIDVRRVAAVVRLKEVQRDWESNGKLLATPYAKAVQKMLPKHSFVEGGENAPMEPINEVHVHKLTMQQLFVPVSESRHFTREDAAKAFHESILSADARSQQPELIKMERDVIEGKGKVDPEDRLDEWKTEMQDQEASIAKLLAAKERKEAKRITSVKSDRYEFRFKNVRVDDAGPDGRSRKGAGWRYGAPHEDRKRGKVKIPTSVP